MDIHNVKITAHLTHDGVIYSWEKPFTGTEQQIYVEAHDWSFMLACKYIDENGIYDEDAVQKIIEKVEYLITFELGSRMFAVIDTSDGKTYGVYATQADAEEAIFTESEDFAYEVLMTDDPEDVIGNECWNYPEDWRYLMRDCSYTFAINEVTVFAH